MKRVLPIAGALLIAASALFAAEWKPLDPSDLNLKAGRVDPKADAEILVWHIWVADQFQGEELDNHRRNYIRLKVFTDKAAQKFEPPKIEYSKSEHVSDVAARVIQPDGSIQELKKDAIFDHVLDKSKGKKDRAVSFAIPGIKVGSIIEYQWKETDEDSVADNMLLPLWNDYPVEKVVLHIKPLEIPEFTMDYMPYHTQDYPKFQKEGGTGYFITEINNIQKFPDEQDGPPELDVRPFITIWYSKPFSKASADAYWAERQKMIAEGYKPYIKVNGDVKSLAQQIAGGAQNPEEQLQKLAMYCRKNIKDIWAKDVSDADRKHIKENHTTADTLKRGIGSKLERQLAFLALCRGLGFDAQVARVGDRELITFFPSLMNPIFLPWIDIAVNVNGNWKIYDVTANDIVPGKLRWQEEGTRALVCGQKELTWAQVPLTASADNKLVRMAKLSLDETGSIEGDFEETRTGHEADVWRAKNQDLSGKERENLLKKRVEERFPGAELSNIKLSDPNDVEAPVKVTYHLKQEGFATRTGKRLIFDPNVFAANSPARYVEADRTYNLYWNFAWQDIDDYTIKFPDGFAPDHPQIPANKSFSGAGEYKVRMQILNGDTISYHREVSWGDKGAVVLEKKYYPTVKAIFDYMHSSDTSIVTLKEKQEAAEVHQQ